MLKDILAGVICGVEHSGTYAMLQAIKASSEIDAGGEGGFLLVDSPIKFKNWHPYVDGFIKDWQVTVEDLDYILDAKSWEVMYYRVRERSKTITDKSLKLIDKTPGYIYHRLCNILNETEDVPFIIMRKDPRNMVYSLTKRGISVNKAIEIYMQWYVEKLEIAATRYGDRIMVMQWEDLITNSEDSVKKAYAHFGLTFDDTVIRHAKDKMHGNVLSFRTLPMSVNVLVSRVVPSDHLLLL